MTPKLQVALDEVMAKGALEPWQYKRIVEALDRNSILISGDVVQEWNRRRNPPIDWHPLAEPSLRTKFVSVAMMYPDKEFWEHMVRELKVVTHEGGWEIRAYNRFQEKK